MLPNLKYSFSYPLSSLRFPNDSIKFSSLSFVEISCLVFRYHSSSVVVYSCSIFSSSSGFPVPVWNPSSSLVVFSCYIFFSSSGFPMWNPSSSLVVFSCSIFSSSGVCAPAFFCIPIILQFYCFVSNFGIQMFFSNQWGSFLCVFAVFFNLPFSVSFGLVYFGC